ncbi:hypothetical protein [Sphingomonas sanxanigenens]|uniref:Uncharacterized protein n=1 Tax=Sphingomonas sanxanigenens DSM 19645 = NX02 TaxID=1123269 RepID=W0AIR6_9SPHN|nr:hypothetical protein [Sphingomonas sanxanigenens]AHE55540.1 hypothetical protein NX02_19400 [Sphingomonas sanxanigenens DSM 19645 = NX02]
MIDLPTDIGGVQATPRLLDFGGFLEPSLGGEVQRLNRLGSRFALSVTLPPLESDREGRIWVSRLLRGKTEGARWEYPLLDFDPGNPGSFVVNGAGQAGKQLAVRGGTSRYAFKEGQPLSIFIGGRHYLHFVDSQVIATASGTATIMITPMLRVPPADGDALHVARPMIEGLLMGDETQWQISADRLLAIAFEIHERR